MFSFQTPAYKNLRLLDRRASGQRQIYCMFEYLDILTFLSTVLSRKDSAMDLEGKLRVRHMYLVLVTSPFPSLRKNRNETISSKGDIFIIFIAFK